jgi:hypothetical protein
MAERTACAPLASTKDEIMKMISPAPANPSLIHMIGFSLFVGLCSSYVPVE